jgi:hypothetical protein
MKILPAAVALFFVVQLNAQSTLRPSLYFPNFHYYNPAVGLTGGEYRHDVSAYYKSKFTDNDEAVWNKPANVWLNYVGQLNERSGFSAAYIYDAYSFYTQNQVYAGYYRDLLENPEKSLTVGGRAVLNFDRVNWEEAPQAGRTGTETFFRPDLDLGVQYTGKRFGAGISTKNLLNSTVEIDGEALIENQREWYANASFRFNVGNFNITPFVLGAWERDVEVDAGLSLDMNRRVQFAYILRTFEIRHIFTLQADVFKGVYLGAGADFSQVFDDVNLDLQAGYRF